MKETTMMTEKDIRKLLSDINKNKVDGKIITRPLSETVDYAKIWLEILSSPSAIGEHNLIPQTAYLIYEKEIGYFAAVLADDSLKWYVLPQYKKSNLFLNSFKNTVIPHILQHKPIQRLLLNRAEYSEKEYTIIKRTALAIGFKITRENEREVRMSIEAASLGKREYIVGKNACISEKRKQEIKAEISFFLQKLHIFETEVELKTGDIEYVEDIKEIIAALTKLEVR